MKSALLYKHYGRFALSIAVLFLLTMTCRQVIASDGAPAMNGDSTVESSRSMNPDGRLTLFGADKPQACIVIAADASRKVREAAALLQSTLQQMTGASVVILSDSEDVTGTRLLVGPSRYTQALGVEVEQKYYPVPERSIVRRIGSDIVIIGNDSGKLDLDSTLPSFYIGRSTYQGTRRAAYLFLEQLGCGWFGPDSSWHVIPQSKEISVDEIDIDLTPAFEARYIWWPWKDKDLDPSAWGLACAQAQSHHNLYYMFPPKDYFEKHPDFYSMVNGRRVAEGGQLNFGNPEVVTRAAKLVAESFQSQPDVWINYSLTANDWGGFDESPETIALGKTASEQSLAFANNVVTEARKTVPDAKVMFLAYWYTSKAPESNIKAAPGVAVMLVNNTCKGHSLESPLDPAGAVWIKNFDRWAETGAELGVYDWYIPAFHDAIAADIPFIPGEAALQDLRLYQKRGVKYLFYESYNGEKVEAYPIRWPMYYIAAMGMENPDRSATDILRPACDKLFGSAGDAMLRFYLLIAEAYNTTKARGNNWTLPAANIVFSSEITAKLRETLKEAQNVTANADPAVRKRIADVARCWALAETIISGQKKTQKYEIVAEGLGSFFFDKHHIDVPTIRSLVGIADNLQVGVVEKDGSVTPLNPDLPVKLDPDHPLTVRAIAN